MVYFDQPVSPRTLHRLVTLAIALVWIGFGLVCKVLDLVPRHEEIVARILGGELSGPITRSIGGLEVLMGLWVASGIRSRSCAIVQMVLVGVMNALEISLAADLLLWGPFNAVFAVGLIALVWFNEWVLGKRGRG